MRKPKKRLFKRKSHVNKCMIIQTFHQAIHWSRALRNSIISTFCSEIREELHPWELIQLLETYHVGRKNVWNRWKYTDSHVKTKRHFFCFRRLMLVSNIHIRRIPPETRRDWFRKNKPMKHFVRIKAKFKLKKGGRCYFWGLLFCDDRRFPLTPSWFVWIPPVSLQSNP